MRPADLEQLRDLRCRYKGDVDAIEAGNLAAIATLAADLAQHKAGAREQLRGLIHEAALGRDG